MELVLQIAISLFVISIFASALQLRRQGQRERQTRIANMNRARLIQKEIRRKEGAIQWKDN